MTLKQLQNLARMHNMEVVKQQDGEYRVSYRARLAAALGVDPEATAYYTNDIDDAAATLNRMINED